MAIQMTITPAEMDVLIEWHRQEELAQAKQRQYPAAEAHRMRLESLEAVAQQMPRGPVG